jgi:hypothetical protein
MSATNVCNEGGISPKVVDGEFENPALQWGEYNPEMPWRKVLENGGNFGMHSAKS